MTTPVPTTTPQDRATQLLPQVEITYAKQGDAFVFTLTRDDDKRTLTYTDADKRWTCDCDAFDDATCVHVDLVKLWRSQAKQAANGNGNGVNGAAPGASTAKSPNGAATPGHRKGRKPATAAPTSAFPTPATGVSVWSKQVAEALLAPFPADMVGWKAQATTKDNSRAMAVAYIDARCVMDRLDEVVGPENWSDSYNVLGDQTGSFGKEVVVECRLTVLGVTKCDVGVGEDGKSAYSDAFKRAGVKCGIGRYLYSLDKQWVAYDAKTKQLSAQPQLPAWAIPNAE